MRPLHSNVLPRGVPTPTGCASVNASAYKAALGKSNVDQYHAQEADKVLSPVAKFIKRHRIEAKQDLKVGSACTLIGKLADTGKFDLLVMGSHGHSALGNLVMGSVATQVLAHCKTPVLLVR